ncbi:oxidoreductase [Histoplasma capsulatum G186AR]|uniref:Oxidoreductase n=2 Tax=Ajellomyces capsulatus TaxID=5037 RepID=C0NP01_AJECG|nr:oxidoreductase [Histoplasma capsulatum G186AR]EEH06661.1 oxidoreductase [Histoplasma capsulatum G186AR]KAG5304806.1 oxidoreductase [Histoplasma capsulatum]QSS75765.1 oxidoreductase [Histoplasma capsulatum G186AR]
MSYEENFTGIPPFPDDVLCTPLLRLSMEKLIAHDETEVQRFYTACKDLGFFYLDLRGHEILEDANQLFTTGEQLFELDLDEKRRYDFSKENSYFGYKELGAAVVDPQGNSDRNEFYNVSKDDILGISETLPAPDLLKECRSLFKSFIINAHNIVTMILNLLNDSLHLPPSTLANMHRLHAISGDQVRIIKAPPQPADDRRTSIGQHTDFGSVTVLFNRVGGLQILPPGQDAEWCYARPLPGHAIINLGDAMVKFTNGLLRSNIHRVVSPPGAQAETTRYSLVYFARPEDDVILKRLEGSDCIPPLTLRDETGAVVEEEEIRSKDWIIRRALGNRRALHKEIDYAQSMGTESMSRRIYA